MLRKIVFFFLSWALLPPSIALAQGAYVSPQTAFKKVNGVTVPFAGATITVCAAATGGAPCSPPLVGAIFQDAALTQPLSNPFTADANGNYQFAIAAGTYTVTVTGSGFSGYSYQITVGADGGGGSSNFSSITVANQALIGTNGQSGQQAWFFTPDINGGVFYYDPSNSYDQFVDVFSQPVWCQSTGFCQNIFLVSPLPFGVNPSVGQVPAYTTNGFQLGAPIQVQTINLGTNASATGQIGLANGNTSGATVPLQNSTYQTSFTFDIADPGYDIRGFGALQNGTGVSGVGHDDSAALALCLAAFNDCTIRATARGATTHVRLATPQIFAPLTDGGRRLHCVGENQQDSGGGSTGTVSIDVDIGGGTSGPALWLGSQNVSLQQGLSIDNSCRFRDISSGHNSPGAIGMMNTSNNQIDSGYTGFLLAPLGKPTSPGSIASCTTTGGSISSAGSIFRVDEQIGPGWGSSIPSTEVSATSSSLGCTSGSTCSCTPTAPTLTAGAVADIVLLGTSSGGEHQVGMPYSCPSANCGSMTTLFNYGSPTTSATAIASIPLTGNKPDAFDHSGGYGVLMMGTAGMNATNNGGVAGSTTYVNQPKFMATDCYNNNSCLDLEHNVAMAEIAQLHIRIQNGKFGIQNEYNGEFNLVNFHIENIPASGSGAGLNLSGAPNLSNGLIESGNVSTAINGVGLVSANLSGTACGASVGTCFTDDATSGFNNIQLNNIQGTVTIQPTDEWCGGGFCKSLQTIAITGADVTCGTGGTIASCTGFQVILSRALPSVQLNWGFTCDLVVSQATAAVANQVGVGTTSHAPTNLTASATAGGNTSATTVTPIADVSSTSAQSLLTFTPTAAGSKVPIHVSGFIEGTSNTGTTFNIVGLTGSNADLLTFYRGSTCWLY